MGASRPVTLRILWGVEEGPVAVRKVAAGPSSFSTIAGGSMGLIIIFALGVAVWLIFSA